jgi:hypothetical protein
MVRTPITPAALAADPGGFGAFPRTFDIKVTQGAGEKWSFGTVKGTLNTGTYSPGTGSFYIPSSNNAHIQQAGGTANLAFDTYVTTPDGGASTTILGKADYPVNPASAPLNEIMPGTDANRPSAVNDPKTVDITWGNLQAVSSASGDSAYTVARLTTTGKSGGAIVGHVGGTQHNNTDVPFSFVIPMNADFGSAGGAPDGFVDGSDIAGFISALSNPGGFQTATGINPVWIGDFTNDGFFDGSDIAGFIGILSSAGEPLPADGLAALGALVPEPTSAAVLGLSALGFAARRRRTA